MIVTADGRVSDAEVQRLIGVGKDVVYALGLVFDVRHEVHLPFAVAEKLGEPTWAAALPDALHLPPPNATNIGEFMDVVYGWLGGISSTLLSLRSAALEVLLATEHHIATCVLEGTDPGDAVDVARVPRRYTAFCHGAERPLQLKLDAWDRFMTADGWVPGIARLAVAGSIVALVVTAGGTVAPTLVIHNGLGREVTVALGEREVTVAGSSNLEVELDSGDDVEVVTRTTDGEEIERFTGDVERLTATYVYNVGGASLMVVEQAGHGRVLGLDPDVVGTVRWFESNADRVLERAPEERGNGQIVTVLQAIDDPVVMARGWASEEEIAHALAFHVRWEPLVGRGSVWFVLGAVAPGLAEIAEARLVREPGAVLLERIAQDASTGDAHAAACARSRDAAERNPADPDAGYLAARCIESTAAEHERFIALAGDHPDHGWIQQAAAAAYAERDELAAAVGSLQRAMKALPMLDFRNAVTLARLLRVTDATDRIALSRLAKRSRDLEVLIAGDPDVVPHLRGDSLVAIRALDGGLLDEVRARAGGDAVVLRLLAASDDATPEDLDTIDRLAPEVGTEGPALWSALALAYARHREPAPYLALAQARVEPRHLEVMRELCDDDLLLGDLATADARLRTLPPELRGHAAAMGIIALRDKAPPRWRDEARKLLFPAERPYFAPPSPFAGLR